MHRLQELRGCLPLQAIYFNEGLNIAQKCTGCAHLLDSGWKEPRCADACPTLAFKFMEEDEAKELHCRKPRYGNRNSRRVKPRVYYLNLPKKFIAGTVYDPVKKKSLSVRSAP